MSTSEPMVLRSPGAAWRITDVGVAVARSRIGQGLRTTTRKLFSSGADGSGSSMPASRPERT